MILMIRLHTTFRFQADRYQERLVRWINNIKRNLSSRISSFKWRSSCIIMGSKIWMINTFFKTALKICLCKFKTEAIKYNKRWFRMRNLIINKYSSFSIRKLWITHRLQIIMQTLNRNGKLISSRCNMNLILRFSKDSHIRVKIISIFIKILKINTSKKMKTIKSSKPES